jgi:hypothetical protein
MQASPAARGAHSMQMGTKGVLLYTAVPTIHGSPKYEKHVAPSWGPVQPNIWCPHG